jgi:hypothetical protein
MPTIKERHRCHLCGVKTIEDNLVPIKKGRFNWPNKHSWLHAFEKHCKGSKYSKWIDWAKTEYKINKDYKGDLFVKVSK